MVTNEYIHVLIFCIQLKITVHNKLALPFLQERTHLRFKTAVLKTIRVLLSLVRGWPELQSSRVDVEASVSGGETSWDKLIILRHAKKIRIEQNIHVFYKGNHLIKVVLSSGLNLQPQSCQ